MQHLSTVTARPESQPDDTKQICTASQGRDFTRADGDNFHFATQQTDNAQKTRVGKTPRAAILKDTKPM